MAPKWEGSLHALRDLPHVVDIRNLGLVGAVELTARAGVPGSRGYDVFVECFRNGLLVRVTGDTIALSPPLIIEDRQIDDIVSILGDAIKRTA